MLQHASTTLYRLIVTSLMPGDELNSSREAADTTLGGSLFNFLAVLVKKELKYFVSLILS